ncbi:MAG: guanylate kinase [Candidatus Nitronauta litoralis]|uniref:Guanylate kinase n=1 Tax=Candidatus Nitronauta litoralis TaxID=2705533 RepID=A0A7T0BYE1_9BACT|nr:MAG: guanylate kinase [Candidatus Nitronauta litoralis]
MSSPSPNQGLALIVSAPSGTGKTTVCGKLREQIPDLRFKISDTTRQPREGEKDGIHYHFISEDTFQNGIKNGDYLEWAQVHTDHYGTRRNQIEQNLQQGYDLLMELDVQGVTSLREQNFDGIFVLILPPSLSELEKRLVGRGTESPEKIQKRLETAKSEIAQYKLFDYIVTNNEVNETVSVLNNILQSERFKTTRFRPKSDEILSIFNSQETN